VSILYILNSHLVHHSHCHLHIVSVVPPTMPVLVVKGPQSPMYPSTSSHVLRYSGDIGCPLNISKHEILHVKHPSPMAALFCLLLRFCTVSTSGVCAFLFVAVSSRLVTSHALLISKIGGCAFLFLVTAAIMNAVAPTAMMSPWTRPSW
jgi:hypothetical protein